MGHGNSSVAEAGNRFWEGGMIHDL
jgi:hypothetical protein